VNRYQIVVLLGFLLLVVAVSFSQAQDGRTAPAKEDLLDMKTLVKGNNEFAWDLYGRLSQQKGNVVFSPYSISTALAMTYGGARGKTADEMAKTLHFTLPQERLHPAFGELMREMQPKGQNPPYRLEVANGLWTQQGFPIMKEFQDLVGKHYGAGLTSLNFQHDAKGARQTINHWVAERTHNKINNFLAPEDVKAETRLILTNAAYFKASWLQPFDKNQTKQEDFEVAPGRTVKVPMMHLSKGRFNYHTGNDFQILEMPYKDNRLDLVILLPTNRGQLADLEKGLTAVKVEASLSRLTVNEGDVALPSFKVEFRTKLRDDLQALGMSLPFSDVADFSGINGSFRISKVVHQAMINVDEQGTEAAAATAVIGNVSAVRRRFSFRADHPFLFLLRDKRTGAILFLGRVTEI
jgi:serpin B